MSDDLLHVRDLCAGYGTSRVLDGVSFCMGVEAVALIGRNGMGKTTLCNTTHGSGARPRPVKIVFNGERIDNQVPEKIAKHGVSYVPQGRRLFPSLTVDEHLTMLAKGTRGKRWTIERVYEMFPRLAERRRNGGAELSGGEQQMLAVGRALLLNGSLVIMDEPSEGLAPTIVDTLIDVVHRLVAEGVAVLVVEQNLRAAVRMADRQLVMVSGRIQAETSAAELIANPELQQRVPRRRRCRHARQGDVVTGNINIALLGSKFMGRAHSNAWLNVAQVLRRRSVSDDAHRRRSQRRPSCTSSPNAGAGSTTRPTGVPPSRPTTSGSSTSAHPTTFMRSRRSPRSRPASTSPARSRSPERWPMRGRWPPPRWAHRARRRCGSTIDGCRPLRWLIVWLPPAGSVGSITCVPRYLQSWGGPDTPLLWRFQGDIAGSGAHGDLNAHIIDSVRFVTGEEIVTIEGAIEHTFIEERAVLEGETGGEIAGAGASTTGATGAEHRRRRRVVPRPAERRGSCELRSHSPRHRLSQRQPLRDPR